MGFRQVAGWRELKKLRTEPFMASRDAQVWHEKKLGNHAHKNADRVCDKVLPREDMPEDQMTQRGVTNTRQPGRLVELECFNPEGEAERPKPQLKAGGLVEDDPHAQEHHEGPQGISWVFADVWQVNRQEASRCQTCCDRCDERE